MVWDLFQTKEKPAAGSPATGKISGGDGGIRTHGPAHHRSNDFESSVKKRTWRNLTEDKRSYVSLKPAVFQGFFDFSNPKTVAKSMSQRDYAFPRVLIKF